VILRAKKAGTVRVNPDRASFSMDRQPKRVVAARSKAILRDLVNATVGFEALAAAVNEPAKSLHRKLAPPGNPSTENFFDIVCALQKKTRVKLCVTAKAA
jgi:hypothetical protein